MKLVPAMGLLQAKARAAIRIGELEQEVQELQCSLLKSTQDRDLLAQAMCRTGDFNDWLMEQDVSSAHMRKPWRQRDAEVEGKSDLELALAFCNRPNAG